jgi:hypothetical protein
MTLSSQRFNKKLAQATLAVKREKELIDIVSI